MASKSLFAVHRWRVPPSVSANMLASPGIHEASFSAGGFAGKAVGAVGRLGKFVNAAVGAIKVSTIKNQLLTHIHNYPHGCSPHLQNFIYSFIF